jgi:hypothetical protein
MQALAYQHSPIVQRPPIVPVGVYLGLRLKKARDFWTTGRIDERDYAGCEVRAGGVRNAAALVCERAAVVTAAPHQPPRRPFTCGAALRAATSRNRRTGRTSLARSRCGSPYPLAGPSAQASGFAVMYVTPVLTLAPLLRRRAWRRGSRP